MNKQTVPIRLDIHAWQIEHIKKGLHQANIGHFAKKSEVTAAFNKWKKG